MNPCMFFKHIRCLRRPQGGGMVAAIAVLSALCVLRGESSVIGLRLLYLDSRARFHAPQLGAFPAGEHRLHVARRVPAQPEVEPRACGVEVGGKYRLLVA